jgi:hypothetical protein
MDVANATAAANAEVRSRMQWKRSYLQAIQESIKIVAELIADEGVRGHTHYAPWLAEYTVLCQMRHRHLCAWDQEQARRIALADAAKTRREQCEAAGCTGRHA